MGSRVKVIEKGERFDRLETLERRDSGAQKRVLCRCDCGVEKLIDVLDLAKGKIRSCGCLRRDTTRARNMTHGWTSDPLFHIWLGMIARCTDPKNPNYYKYGGRGITVDSWWLNFEHFTADMSPRPPGKTLDRIYNNGNYSPSNCRWATISQQNANRRARGESKYKYVKRHTSGKWQASPWINGEMKYLGLFPTVEEAAQAVSDYYVNRDKSLDELAQEQGVEAIESIDDLRGDDEMDEDDFAKFIRAIRGE